MKIVIAPDSFKGSLTSREACSAIADGILRVFPNAECKRFPIADGGEGTLDTIIEAMDGVRRAISVRDPLGRTVSAEYGILPEGIAVIETATAAGLTLLSPEERDPRITSTYGVGELIADALRQGCHSFLIGLGGSATNDGGTGMLSALGVRFLNAKGEPIPPGAAGLAELERIDASQLLPGLRECNVFVACDVTNPLCGPKGCSAVFSPQKGATPESIPTMDRNLARFAEKTKELFPSSDETLPGSGAAGGMGFALRSYLDGVLMEGSQLILKQTGFEEALHHADLVVTGEGRLDGQTAMGKAPAGVAAVARERYIPVIAFAGEIAPGAEVLHELGISAIFSVTPRAMSASEAMEKTEAAKNLTRAVEEAFRFFRLGLPR